MEAQQEKASTNIYELHDKPPLSVTITAALQWFFVILSSSLVVPLVVGQAYGLGPADIGVFMQQTFFLIGLASILQVLFGHRLPLTEGPAGMWWGIFIILANLGMAAGKSPQDIGRSLEMGLIITGIMLVGLGVTGIIGKIQKLFTPLVTGGYILLLAVSLSSSLMKGLLGMGYTPGQTGIPPKIALVSIGLIVFTFMMIRSKHKYIRSFAILISMLVGWLIYGLLGWTKPLPEMHGLVSLPTPFFWGTPEFDLGTILISMLTGLILLTNLVASIVVVGQVVHVQAGAADYRRGGIFTGIAHMLSGTFGIVGLVPLSITAGVIQVTRIASRLPFLIACGLFMLLGMLPQVSRVLSGLPAPVGYAVSFVSFTQLIGFGLQDLGKVTWNERTIMIIGFGLLTGIGIMFVPPEAMLTLPPFVSYIFGNGLVMGVLLIIFLEQIVLREKRRL